ncbi:hypothetical protein HK405_000252, partial [Cladochytrium tenue]
MDGGGGKGTTTIRDLVNSGTSVMKGFLEKQSTSTTDGSPLRWSRRFAVLGGHTVFLFRSDDPASIAVAAFPLTARSDVMVSADSATDGLANVLTLRSASNAAVVEASAGVPRTWRLRAADEDAALDWLVCVQAAIEECAADEQPLPPPLKDTAAARSRTPLPLDEALARFAFNPDTATTSTPPPPRRSPSPAPEPRLVPPQYLADHQHHHHLAHHHPHLQPAGLPGGGKPGKQVFHHHTAQVMLAPSPAVDAVVDRLLPLVPLDGSSGGGGGRPAANASRRYPPRVSSSGRGAPAVFSPTTSASSASSFPSS